MYIFAAKMKETILQTRYPDAESSQTIGLLRWVLIALVVVIHTNLVADSGAANPAYSELYRWLGNVVWLANPLFYLISGYLFVASRDGFGWKVFVGKCRGRLRTWLIPYLLWNTIFLLFYGVVGLLYPSALGVVPPLNEMTFTDVLRAYWSIHGDDLTSPPIDGPLWFLRDLMVVAAFTPLYFAIIRQHKASIVLPLLIASLPHQVWCESSMAYFMVGIWLNVWTLSLSELLRKPVWRPLPVYIAASVALMLSHPWTEWTTAPLTLIRNLFGMTVVARICHRVTLRHPDRDWRVLAEPVFFVFALHSMFARPLTKLSANWLVSHDAGCPLYLTMHLLNAAIALGFSLLVYCLLKRVLPTVCAWLSGTPKTKPR